MIPASRIFAEPSAAASAGLAARCRALLEAQKSDWPACGKGFASLAQAATREVAVRGYRTTLQWNPQRIVSTAAKTDAASISARPCFLCLTHLPPEQKAVPYRDAYLILCNPSPIFPEHFTVSHAEHRPQELSSCLDDMLGLATDLAGAYTVFYNGPRCGASAPDHLHLQAVPSGAIPAETQLTDPERMVTVAQRDGITLSTVPDFGRTALSVSGHDAERVGAACQRVADRWKERSGSPDEPLMNVLAFVRNDTTHCVVFFRSKHRPEAYFREDDRRVLVSPAAVDIGGHVVTPVEKDFRSLDGPSLEGIFTEVCADPSVIPSLAEAA